MVGIFKSSSKTNGGSDDERRSRSRERESNKSGFLSKLLPPQISSSRSRSRDKHHKPQEERSPSPGLIKRTGRRLSWRSGTNTRDASPHSQLGGGRSEEDLTGVDTDVESVSGGIVPHNAFDESEPEDEDTDSDDGWDEYEPEEDALDIEVFRNTSANTGDRPVMNILESQSRLPTPEDDHPNMLHTEPPVFFVPPETNSDDRPEESPSTLLARPSVKRKELLPLHQAEPLFERNRCTVNITHGDPDNQANQSKRTRKYLVASDLSEESQYAVEWAIGTVLRNGDEAIIVSVMETDSKLDSDKSQLPDFDELNSPKPSTSQLSKPGYLADRETRAALLAKQSVAFLKRTRLHVKLSCQAIHARNAKHMLIDMIDYVEPTLVIIGSRGLTKIKGMLLGSVSYYLVQKSSVPVMVARRRLRRQSKARKSLTSLDRHARVPLSQAETERESTAGQVQHEGQPLERTMSELEDDEMRKELLAEKAKNEETLKIMDAAKNSSEAQLLLGGIEREKDKVEA